MSRQSRSRSARASVLWALAAYGLIQLAVLAWTRADPGFADQEFAHKLGLLRAQLAAHPGRPLVLMLGSSRVASGFAPSALGGARLDDGRAPVVFNFALVGRGPEMAHLALRRLLDAGIRPRRVLVEYWPPFWGVERHLPEFLAQVNVAGLGHGEVDALSRYVHPKARTYLYRPWLAARLSPLYANRAEILKRYAPAWLAAPRTPPNHHCQDLDPLGWWTPVRSVDASEYRARTKMYADIYRPKLADYRTRDQPDRALRAVIALCRREGIEPGVVVLPEGAEFRALYPDRARVEADRYLAALRAETGVPVIDARLWAADADFMDAHHLLPAGAVAFSARLGREAFPAATAAAAAPARR